MAKFTQKKLALLFVAPQLLITVIFFLWPACSALLQSLFFGDAFGIQQRFAGLVNFTDLLHDPAFVDALYTTLVIAFLVTVFTMSFGLLLAILVQGRKRSQAVYKTLLLWPYAIAPAVAAILWRFICQPSLGWLSQGLGFLGIDFNYLTNPKQALAVVIFTASWQQLSYNFLFFLAALKAIPQTLIDAAIMDGANFGQRFWHVVLPLLAPTTFFLLIMNLIYGFFETFGIIDVLTSGGPGISTTTLIYKIYKDGFVGMDPGSSAAQSVVLMVIVIGLTLIQFRYLENKVHYE